MKNATAEVLAEAFDDAKEVVETANKNGLVTTKRLLLVGAVVLAVTTTVLVVKKVKAAKAEAEQA